MKTNILLINLGTPDSPKTGDVRKYLREFLNDPHVITLPWLIRKLLVNLIIVPFRAPRSAKLYKELWTPNGSPLLINTENFRRALQKKLGDDYPIELGMRYGKPSILKSLNRISQNHPQKLILVPLYPQYASSTTSSSLQKVMGIINKWEQKPHIQTIHHFHDHPGFIRAFAERIKTYQLANYDHIIMSYHGLPLSHLKAAHSQGDCETMRCASRRNSHNQECYLASCFETSRLLADQLQLKEQDYTVCFQSRFSKNWTSPFTDEVVEEWAQKGQKKLLVISPAFVADCLETLHELGQDLKNDFEQNGGAKLTLVESLNDMPLWVEAMAEMIQDK